MECLIAIIVVFAVIFYVLIGGGKRKEYDLKTAHDLEKLRLTKLRADMAIEQKRGVTERYRMTQENRINAMLNQQKKELEIEVLQLKKEQLEKELGKSDEPFNPQP